MGVSLVTFTDQCCVFLRMGCGGRPPNEQVIHLRQLAKYSNITTLADRRLSSTERSDHRRGPMLHRTAAKCLFSDFEPNFEAQWKTAEML